MSSSRSTEIAAAFSDTTRVRLLQLMRDEERCVGDLVSATGSSQSSVSRHLACLLRARLVCARTEGLRRFYRLAPVDHPLQECLLGCLGRCLAGIGAAAACPPRGHVREGCDVGWGAERTRVKISG